MTKEQIDSQIAIIKHAIMDENDDEASKLLAVNAFLALMRDGLICLNILAGRAGPNP